MKICITCKASKSLDEFGNYKRYPDGKHRVCLVCWNIYAEKQRRARGMKVMSPFLNRLWDNIQQCGHEDLYPCPYCCWPWLKALDGDGYGHISIAYNGLNRPWPAPRIVYEVWHGILIPDDYCACHYCDYPACCNPIHIWVGTRADNRFDCIDKGRHAQGVLSGHVTKPEAFPRGAQHYRAKLTDELVLQIRAAHKRGRSANSLGIEHNVSKQTILAVLNRETWKHI